MTGSGTEPVLFWVVSLQEGMERGNKEMRRMVHNTHNDSTHSSCSTKISNRSSYTTNIRFDWGNTGSTLSKGVRGKNQATEENFNAVLLHIHTINSKLILIFNTSRY